MGESGCGQQGREDEEGDNCGHGHLNVRSERTSGQTDAFAWPFTFAAPRGDGTCLGLLGGDATSTLWGHCPERSHMLRTELGAYPGCQ